MDQHAKEEEAFDEIVVSDNFGESKIIPVPRVRGGHGGGDKRLKDQIFRDEVIPDPLHHSAGSRDGLCPYYWVLRLERVLMRGVR